MRVDLTNANLDRKKTVAMNNCVPQESESRRVTTTQLCSEYYYIEDTEKYFGA